MALSLQDRKVQIGGGVGAVALLAGAFFLWPEGSAARIEKACGPAPAAISDVGLAGKVASASDAVMKAIGSPNLMTEIENQAVLVFRETPATSRGDVEKALNHGVCAAVVGANAGGEGEKKLALAKEALLKGLQTATEERQAQMTACVEQKRTEASAKQPFVIKGEARAVSPAADGKEVVDTKSVCQTAPAGFDFVSAQVRKTACADDARCAVQEVRYAADADGNKQACVDFEAKSEAKPFGSAGFLTVELFGEISKPMTPEMEAQIQADCGGTPAAAPAAPAEPVTVDPATPAPAGETPAAPPAPEGAAPAMPDAGAPAEPAPAEPAPAAPVTP
jgi:hypothetical protein